jgi:hypothetical protein
VNEIYLRKVAGFFFPIWSFPRINLLCSFLSLVYVSIAQYMIYMLMVTKQENTSNTNSL